MITLLSLTLKEHVTYSFIDSNNGGGAGANPGAAPFFFSHTHIRAKAQGADRLAGHLDRGRRAPRSGKVNKHTPNVNQLAGAQTCGARTLTRGRRN